MLPAYHTLVQIRAHRNGPRTRSHTACEPAPHAGTRGQRGELVVVSFPLPLSLSYRPGSACRRGRGGDHHRGSSGGRSRGWGGEGEVPARGTFLLLQPRLAPPAKRHDAPRPSPGRALPQSRRLLLRPPSRPTVAADPAAAAAAAGRGSRSAPLAAQYSRLEVVQVYSRLSSSF